MSIDREKLKALAEAQPIQDWRRTSGRKPHMPGQRLIYGVEGPEGVSDYEDWGFTGKAAEYIAAACPATMLALLAEIEQLRESHEQVCTNYNRVSFVAEERGKERDQLKTENEALRKDAERYRFVRNPIGTSSPLAIWNEGKMPLFSGMADAVVDEFMGKEESHD